MATVSSGARRPPASNAAWTAVDRREDAFAEDDDREQAITLDDVARVPGGHRARPFGPGRDRELQDDEDDEREIAELRPSDQQTATQPIWTSAIPTAKRSATERRTGSSRAARSHCATSAIRMIT